jgi:pimeloyl-ACP methyl ester carboxylesterase
VESGFELHRWEAGGEAPAILCIHETATTSEAWRPLARAIGERARIIAYDRRGWGRSGAPEPYTRTTIHEQSDDAARVLGAAGAGGALICAAGLGAVAALDLLLRVPALVQAAALIEPPLLAFVPEATDALLADGDSLRGAVHGGGPAAGLDRYLSGELHALGAGADRLPDPITAPARERPLTLFAELGAVASWQLEPERLARNDVDAALVTSEDGPTVLRQAAVALEGRLGAARHQELPGAGPAHLDRPTELAELILGP